MLPAKRGAGQLLFLGVCVFLFAACRAAHKGNSIQARLVRSVGLHAQGRCICGGQLIGRLPNELPSLSDAELVGGSGRPCSFSSWHPEQARPNSKNKRGGRFALKFSFTYCRGRTEKSFLAQSAAPGIGASPRQQWRVDWRLCGGCVSTQTFGGQSLLAPKAASASASPQSHNSKKASSPSS